MIPGNSIVCFNMFCGVLTRGLMVKTTETERQEQPWTCFSRPLGKGLLTPSLARLLQPGSSLSLSLVSFIQGSAFISHCPKGQILGRFLSTPDSSCTYRTERAVTRGCGNVDTVETQRHRAWGEAGLHQDSGPPFSAKCCVIATALYQLKGTPFRSCWD